MPWTLKGKRKKKEVQNLRLVSSAFQPSNAVWPVGHWVHPPSPKCGPCSRPMAAKGPGAGWRLLELAVDKGDFSDSCIHRRDDDRASLTRQKDHHMSGGCESPTIFRHLRRQPVRLSWALLSALPTAVNSTTDNAIAALLVAINTYAFCRACSWGANHQPHNPKLPIRSGLAGNLPFSPFIITPAFLGR